jgi:hypothetical protein
MGQTFSAHGGGKNNTKSWFGSMKGRAYYEDLGIEGRTISRWIFEKYGGRV